MSCCKQRDGRCLGGSHHRADVVLTKHPLNGNGIGLVSLNPCGEFVGHDQEALLEWQGRIRGDHTHVDEFQRTTSPAIDHTDTTTGQARIYA